MSCSHHLYKKPETRGRTTKRLRQGPGYPPTRAHDHIATTRPPAHPPARPPLNAHLLRVGFQEALRRQVEVLGNARDLLGSQPYLMMSHAGQALQILIQVRGDRRLRVCPAKEAKWRFHSAALALPTPVPCLVPPGLLIRYRLPVPPHPKAPPPLPHSCWAPKPPPAAQSPSHDCPLALLHWAWFSLGWYLPPPPGRPTQPPPPHPAAPLPLPTRTSPHPPRRPRCSTCRTWCS